MATTAPASTAPQLIRVPTEVVSSGCTGVVFSAMLLLLTSLDVFVRPRWAGCLVVLREQIACRPAVASPTPAGGSAATRHEEACCPARCAGMLALSRAPHRALSSRT